MQRSRLYYKLLHLFTKLGNLAASSWDFSKGVQGIFKAAISSQNVCFWLEQILQRSYLQGKELWLREEEEIRTNYRIQTKHFC